MNYKLVICFYFPYHEVSGVPVLFYRIANHLAHSNNSIAVYVIDYPDGAIARNLINNEKIILLPFFDGKSISPPENSILVMQSILPYKMRPELKILPDTKLVFWNLHPDNLVPYLIPLPYLRNFQNKYFWAYYLLANSIYSLLIKKIGKFIELIMTKNSLWFMDLSNLEKTSKYLFLDIPVVEFIPVPVKCSSVLKSTENIRSNHLEFTWIGRLCDFKSHILIFTIKKLSVLSSAKKVKIRYSIIGEGPFKHVINELDVNNEWFSLEILGSLKPSELDEYLLENTDVLTGMGTSALEGAKLGIPTILLDICYYPINRDYKFRWLHESLNFDLGHDIMKSDFEQGNLSLNVMIDELLVDYKSLSEKALKYFHVNHEMDMVLKKFLNKVNQTELRFSDIDPIFINKSWIRRLYDIIKYKK